MKSRSDQAAVGVLRKGAWTAEEDVLIRKCIHRFGEGNWHQVPAKAGLNRCRKSCRLRWLNYLKPNIKRGEFSPDEVDLIIRLHKLLGNRWSLIAGRLPGRTANDVKNYWNTHLQKKLPEQTKSKQQQIKSTESTIIKPRARAFSKNLHMLRDKNNPSTNDTIGSRENTPNDPSPQILPQEIVDDGGVQFRDNFFEDSEVGWCFDGSEPQLESSNWNHPMLITGENYHQEGGSTSWTDLSVDVNIWDLLNFDQAMH